MLVGSRMTYPVITVGPRSTIEAANELLKTESIHSLPVVDRQGRLLGLVTDKEIDQALGAQERMAGNESDEIVIEDIMIRKVLTVTESTPIEEAARIITDYDVKSLPVLRGNFVVGIMTSTSLIRILLELTGARQPGVRLTFLIEDVPGKIMQVFQAIYDLNGNISTFSTYCTDEKEYSMFTLKVLGVDKYVLKQAITPLAYKLIDIR